MQLTDILTRVKNSTSEVQIAGGNGDLVNAALNKRQEDAAKAAAEQIADLFENVERSLKAEKRQLDDAKKQFEKQTAQFEKVERAFLYMAEQYNPLPYFEATFNKQAGIDFCRENGIEVPCSKSAEWKVPADWQPTAQAAE